MDTRDDAREARSARANASRARAFGSGKLEKTRGRTGSTHQFAREGAQVQVRRVQVPQRRVAVPDVDESVVVLVGSVVVRVRGRVRVRVRPLVLGLAHGLVFHVRVGAPVSEGEILRVTRRVVVRRAVRGAATRVLLGVNVVLRDERFGGVGVFHLLVALGRRRLLGAVGARVLSNPTSHLGGVLLCRLIHRHGGVRRRSLLRRLWMDGLEARARWRSLERHRPVAHVSSECASTRRSSRLWRGARFWSRETPFSRESRVLEITIANSGESVGDDLDSGVIPNSKLRWSSQRCVSIREGTALAACRAL